MKSIGINAVRIPVCPVTLRGVNPTSIDYSKNPDLAGLIFSGLGSRIRTALAQDSDNSENSGQEITTGKSVTGTEEPTSNTEDEGSEVSEVAHGHRVTVSSEY